MYTPLLWNQHKMIRQKLTVAPKEFDCCTIENFGRVVLFIGAVYFIHTFVTQPLTHFYTVMVKYQQTV